MSDLSGLKPGNKVAVINWRWRRRIERVVAIDRITKTCIVTDSRKPKTFSDADEGYAGTRWRIETGHPLGERFSSEAIFPLTKEIEDEFREQKERASIVDFLRRFLDGNWQGMGDERLRKVALALGWETTEPLP